MICFFGKPSFSFEVEDKKNKLKYTFTASVESTCEIDSKTNDGIITYGTQENTTIVTLSVSAKQELKKGKWVDVSVTNLPVTFEREDKNHEVKKWDPVRDMRELNDYLDRSEYSWLLNPTEGKRFFKEKGLCMWTFGSLNHQFAGDFTCSIGYDISVTATGAIKVTMKSRQKFLLDQWYDDGNDYDIQPVSVGVSLNAKLEAKVYVKLEGKAGFGALSSGFETGNPITTKTMSSSLVNCVSLCFEAGLKVTLEREILDFNTTNRDRTYYSESLGNLKKSQNIGTCSELTIKTYGNISLSVGAWAGNTNVGLKLDAINKDIGLLEHELCKFHISIPGLVLYSNMFHSEDNCPFDKNCIVSFDTMVPNWEIWPVTVTEGFSLADSDEYRPGDQVEQRDAFAGWSKTQYSDVADWVFSDDTYQCQVWNDMTLFAVWNQSANTRSVTFDLGSCYYEKDGIQIHTIDVQIPIGCLLSEPSFKFTDGTKEMEAIYWTYEKEIYDDLGNLKETIRVPWNFAADTISDNITLKALWNVEEAIRDGDYFDTLNLDRYAITVTGSEFLTYRIASDSNGDPLYATITGTKNNPVNLIVPETISYTYTKNNPDGSNSTLTVDVDVKDIASGAFKNNSTLRSIRFEKDFSVMIDGFFTNCTKLEFIDLTNISNVTAVPNSWLSGCNSFLACRWPDGSYSNGQTNDQTGSSGITSIGNSAFYGCKGLKCFVIPDSCTSIGANAFNGCWNLKQVDFGEGVQTIGASAFAYNNIEELYLPDSLRSLARATSINYQAPFYGNKNMKRISIGGLEEIQPGMFNTNSTVLEEVEIRGTVGKIGDHAFDSLSGRNGDTSSTSGYRETNHGFNQTGSGARLIIGEGVTSIGYSAFRNCDVFTEVILPDSLTALAAYAFYDCDNIQSVDIPGSVKTIGEKAFAEDHKIKALTIGDGCETIGDMAFWACWNLKEVDFGNTVKSIGNQAFAYNNIEELYLPDSLRSLARATSINYQAPFYGNKNMKRISIGGLEEIQPGMFNTNSTVLEEVEIRGTVGKIGDHAFDSLSGRNGDTSSTSGYRETNHGFNQTGSGARLIIGEGVTSIGYSAFRNCDVFTEVILPDSLTALAAYAFYDCNRIVRFYIGSGTTSINSTAFNSANIDLFVVDDANATAYNLLAEQGKNVVYASMENASPVVLTFDANGGLFDGEETLRTETLSWRDPFPQIEEPVSDGRIFSGWYTDAACTKPWTQTTVPAADTTLYAGWDIDVYTLTLDANGGRMIGNCDAAATAQMRLHAGDTLRSVGAVMQDMVFIGWYLDAACTQPFGGIMPKSDLTVYAGWVYPSAYGEYDFDGGEARLIGYRLLEVESSVVRLPEYVDGMPLTSIADGAFYGEDITELYLPSTLTALEKGALDGMESLKYIGVNPGCESFSSVDGVLFNADRTALIKYPAARGTSYNVPSGIVEIADGAFDGVPLRSIAFNKDLKKIGDAAFRNTRLNRLQLPEGLKHIGQSAFVSIPLTSLTLPDSIVSVGASAFAECDQLAVISAGTGIVTIGANAFEFGAPLALFYGPAKECAFKTYAENYRHIYNGYFVTLHDTNGAERVAMALYGSQLDFMPLSVAGENLEFKGWYLDSNYIEAMPVDMTMPLTNIHLYAQTGAIYDYEQETDRETEIGEDGEVIVVSETPWIKLTTYLSENPEAVIPESLGGVPVTTLAQGCFGSYVTTITIPACVTTIEDGAIPANATIIYLPGTAAEAYAISHGIGAEEKTFTIRFECNGGSSIADRSATANAAIEGVVTERSGYEFAGWFTDSALTEAANTDTEDNLLMPPYDVTVYAAWTLVDNDLADLTFTYEESDGHIVVTGALNDVANVVIPDVLNGMEVTEIRPGAFWANRKLTSVSVPGTIQTIPESAFRNCVNLSNVEIAEGVEVLEANCFSGCSSLTTVILPDSLTTIGSEAFNLSAISYIHLGEGIFDLAPDAFVGCSALTEITLSEANEYYALYDGVLYTVGNGLLIKYPANRQGKAYTILAGTQRISAYAFERASLEHIVLPNTLTALGEGAFRNCYKLAELPDLSVTSVCQIPVDCFNSCESLTSVVIPENITVVREKAFANCYALESMTIPVETGTIASSMVNCTALTVYGQGGSAAQSFADDHGYLFVSEGDILPTDIHLSDDSIELSLGETYVLQAVILPEESFFSIVYWSTTNENAVSVSQTGELHAIGSGSAKITARTENGLMATCMVEVSSVLKAQKLILTSPVGNIFDGDTVEMQVRILPEEATERELLWSSSDENAAVVNEEGVVTALNGGETIIRVTASNGVYAECPVKVLARVRSIEIEELSETLCVGDTLQLTAVVLPENAEDKTIVWTIDETDKAECTADGVLTGIHPGFFTVHAIAQDFGSIEASAILECSGSSVMRLPNQLVSIEEGAFEGNAAEAYELGDLVEAIGSRAFADCKNLYKITIPAVTLTIADDAFDGSDSVTVVAPHGSCAIQFAIDHGIPHIETVDAE